MSDFKPLYRFFRVILIICFAGTAILALPNCSNSNKKPRINKANPDADRSGKTTPDKDDTNPGGGDKTPGDGTTPEAGDKTPGDGTPEAVTDKPPCPPGQTCGPDGKPETTPVAADNKVETCVFEKTYILGASVSAGFDAKLVAQSLLPMIATGTGPEDAVHQLFTQAATNHLLVTKEINSPSKMLAKTFGTTLVDKSDPLEGPLGSEQVEKMLNEDRENFDKASVIIGIDLFYWDAIHANKEAKLCDEAKEALQELTIQAAGKEKPLIIGNVPKENPDNVMEELKMAVPEWQPPKESCVEEINNLLSTACLPEMDCYVLDVYNMVNNLNRDGNFEVEENGGKVSYDLRQLRWDGIHLTEDGSKVVQQLIRDLINTKKPTKCSEGDE